MEIIPTDIPDVCIIKPIIYADDRGYFFESYNRDVFLASALDLNFIQDNESRSMKGVLRGLHFQQNPSAQGKLVRVMRGAVLDVAVDIRKSSPTYGKYVSIVLTGESKLVTDIKLLTKNRVTY